MIPIPIPIPIPIWVIIFSFCLFTGVKSTADEEVKSLLINFLAKLSNSNGQPDPALGWNSTTDPCWWQGVTCDGSGSIRKVSLERLNLSGTLDAASLCQLESLTVLSLAGNNITGEVPTEIANCSQLSYLNLSGNQFYGTIPYPLPMLKRLDISSNTFSGELPTALARVSGLIAFLAHYNQLSGAIPQFDFSSLNQFNVSFNKFSGRIPDVHGQFNASSFLGNSGLCGDPLPNNCP